MRYLIDTTQGDINLLIKSLRRYNKKGLSYLVAVILPKLREGKFDSEELENNLIYIPFDRIFEFIYGKLYIEYYIKDGEIKFILDDKAKYVIYSLYRANVSIIDGIPIIDDNALFKLEVYKNISRKT